MTTDKKEPTSTGEVVAITPTPTEVQPPKAGVPAIEELVKQVKAEFDQKLKEERRYYKQQADRQSAHFQSQADHSKRQAESAEMQLQALQQQQFNSLDSDQKVEYLMSKLAQLERVKETRPLPPPSPLPTVPSSTTVLSIKEAMRENLKAQGIDPDDPSLDWMDDETANLDPITAVKRLGQSAAKKHETKLKAMIEAELEKVKKTTKSDVEREHEVGDYAIVEAGATPSGAIGKGKIYKRSEIRKRMETPLSLTKEERTEYQKAFAEGRVKEE